MVEIPLTTEQFDAFLASRVVAAFDAVPMLKATVGNETAIVPFVSGDAVLIELTDQMQFGKKVAAPGVILVPGRRVGVTIEAIVTRDKLWESFECKTPGYGAPGLTHCAACCGGSGFLRTDPTDEQIYQALRVAPSGEWVALCKP